MIRHMMEAEVFNNKKVFSISEDSLVRFYNSTSPHDYIKFLKSCEYPPSLVGYNTSEDILENIRVEEATQNDNS